MASPPPSIACTLCYTPPPLVLSLLPGCSPSSQHRCSTRTAVLRIWPIEDSQGQILALAFRQRSFKNQVVPVVFGSGMQVTSPFHKWC